jgi:hypothetical protein
MCHLPGCTKETSVGYCARCKVVKYCSLEHQKEHWTMEHKAKCIVIPTVLRDWMKLGISLFQDPATSRIGLITEKEILTGKEVMVEYMTIYSFSKCKMTYATREEIADCIGSVAIQVLAIQDAQAGRAEKSFNWAQFLCPRNLVIDPVSASVEFKVPLTGIDKTEEEKKDLQSWRAHFLQFKPEAFHGDGCEARWLTACFACQHNAMWKLESTMKYLELRLCTSVLNHSCRPNAIVINTADRQSVVTAQTDIKPGEEITISYQESISNFCPTAERQERYMQRFGFLCNCWACTSKFQDNVLTNYPDRNEATDIKMNQDYPILSRCMGLDCDDIKMASTKTASQLQEWVNRSETFILTYKLPNTHWMAHTLRLWSTRMSYQANINDSELPVGSSSRLTAAERQLNWFHAMETARKNVVVNAEILQPLAAVKNVEYNQFKKCAVNLKKSEHDVSNDLLSADPYHEQFCTIWLTTAANRSANVNNNNSSNSVNDGKEAEGRNTKAKLKQKLTNKAAASK